MNGKKSNQSKNFIWQKSKDLDNFKHTPRQNRPWHYNFKLKEHQYEDKESTNPIRAATMHPATKNANENISR
jgi:hypothetical protein